jgi:hypothetical protein
VGLTPDPSDRQLDDGMASIIGMPLTGLDGTLFALIKLTSTDVLAKSCRRHPALPIRPHRFQPIHGHRIQPSHVASCAAVRADFGHYPSAAFRSVSRADQVPP